MASPDLDLKHEKKRAILLGVMVMNNRPANHALCRYVWCVAIGAWVCAMAVSCADRTAANGPTGALVTPGEASPESADLEFDGLIGRIDPDGGSITVEHGPLSKTFKVPPDCEVDISTNANARLAQLKINDPVAVIYSEVGKDLVASRIVRRGRAYEREQREKMERLNDMLYPSPNQ